MNSRSHSSPAEGDSSPIGNSPTNAHDGRTTGAALLVEALVRSGVSTLFGVPGDTGISFYDALYHRTDEIQHVLARDERHAASMADGYARASNTVGVVEVSSGGGVSYVVGGLGEAYAASVPVLVLTSDIHSSSYGTGAMTDIDQEALFGAVTKWRAVVTSASDIPSLVAEALTAATNGRPGPVALIFPEEVLDEEIEMPTFFERVSGRLNAAASTQSHISGIDEAIEALNSATRPAIVAGSGVHMSQASAALEELANKRAIPVATTIQGKGAISEDSPWALGIVGANGAREYANDYVAGSDVVVIVGTRANATDTNSWKGPRRDHEKVIAINLTEYPNATNFPNATMLLGDAGVVLTRLSDGIAPASAGQSAAVASELSASKDEWLVGIAALNTPPDDPAMLNPHDVIRLAHRILSHNCSVVADPGTPTPNVASYWDIAEAGRSIIMPRGHGPMGYAIPGAIGIAMARPDQPVLCVTADGSFAMACGELETVARFNLPIVHIQLTNRSFGWIKMLQHLYLDRRYFGVDPGPIDAPAVAQACGVRGVQITSLQHLEDELRRFSKNPEPLYLNVDVPNLMDVTPPVAPWQDTLAGDVVRPVY